MNVIAIKRDNYGLKLGAFIALLFLLLLFMLNKLNFFGSEPIPSVTTHITAPKIYKKEIVNIISIDESKSLILKNKNSSSYDEKIESFKKYLDSLGYKSKVISPKELLTLGKNSIAFIIESPAITLKTQNYIKEYLKNGGNLFFNFVSGYSDKDGKYIGDGFVNSITGLKLAPKKGFIKTKNDLFMTKRLLTPISFEKNEGKLLDVILYDEIPTYIYPKTLTPDISFTAYNQASAPTSNIKEKNFSEKEAGVLWHGYYGDGKWIYTSLPSYAFYDVDKKKKPYYDDIVEGIINFLSSELTVKPYPFIDKRALTFISEDTEYKYSNFKKFSNLAQKYKLPVTAFIVSGIATRNQDNIALTKSVAKNRYVEFGSHSHTHKKIVGQAPEYIKNETFNTKKILDKYSKLPIIGFRPPREELDDTMKKYLSLGGFAYVLGASQEYLYPNFDKHYPKLLYIPRHGTDDYSYLVNLDWSQKDIVQNMIKELNFITNNLDGIYTLSVHTHLFSFGSNINILDKFYAYLKAHPNFSVVDGRGLTKRVILAKNLHYKTEIKNNKLTIMIKNSSSVPVKNLHLKVFKNPNKTLSTPTFSKGVGMVSLVNSKGLIIVQKIPAKSEVMIRVNIQ